MPATIDRTPKSALSPLERQDQLNAITDRYLSGQMDAEEFLAESRRFNLDFESLVSELAKRQLANRPQLQDTGPDHFLRELDRLVPSGHRRRVETEKRIENTFATFFLAWFLKLMGERDSMNEKSKSRRDAG